MSAHMNFIKILRMDFKRLLSSWLLWGAVIGIAAVQILNACNFYKGEKEDVIQFFSMGDAPFFALAVLILEALPYETSFCEDIKDHYINFVVVRSSPVRYSVSKIICCFTGAILAGLLGRLLYVAVVLPFAAPISPSSLLSAQNNFQGADWFITNHQYFAWIFWQSLERSLQGGLFATFSLFVSTKITNVFAATVMPIIAYYVYEDIAGLLAFPNFLWTTAIFENNGIFPQNFLFGFLYALFFAVSLSLLFGALFIRNVKGRLQDG